MIQFSSQTARVPGGGLGCLLFGALFSVAVYFIVKGLYYVLYYLAPVFLVLALIIEWRAVRDSGLYFWNTLKTNPLWAIILGAIAVFAFPFFAVFLFLQALGYKKIQAMKQQFEQFQTGNPFGFPPQYENASNNDNYVEFEELETKPKPKNDKTLPE